MKTNVLLYSLLFILTACASKVEYESPEGYDFGEPEKILMREALLEISGIAFHHGNSDTLLAVNDESGRLWFLTEKDTKPRFVKFAGSGDYEDIATYKNIIFILRSDGALCSLTDSLTHKKTISSEWKKLFPKGEYESLYIDESKDKLYVLCKKCGKKKKKDPLQGYVISLADTSATVNPFHIDIHSITDDQTNKDFLPSAMARNEKTGEWFIVSSANKLFLITDAEWKPKKIFTIDPGIFIQPEGMAFDDQNNLYISNEGNDLRNGNVLKFRYQPTK